MIHDEFVYILHLVSPSSGLAGSLRKKKGGGAPCLLWRSCHPHTKLVYFVKVVGTRHTIIRFWILEFQRLPKWARTSTSRPGFRLRNPSRFSKRSDFVCFFSSWLSPARSLWTARFSSSRVELRHSLYVIPERPDCRDMINFC